MAQLTNRFAGSQRSTSLWVLVFSVTCFTNSVDLPTAGCNEPLIPALDQWEGWGNVGKYTFQLTDSAQSNARSAATFAEFWGKSRTNTRLG